MKLPERLENAITKLYTAFHKGELDAMNCKHCAVGNLCDNSMDWVGKNLMGEARVCEFFENKTGYSRLELSKIELVFLTGKRRRFDEMLFENTISNRLVLEGNFTKQEQKELQFKGLCAVVKYLCELDNIPNVMEIQSLFQYEGEKALHELNL